MPTAILPVAPVKADALLSSPNSIQVVAPIKTDVPVSSPIQPVNSDVPVFSPSGFLLPDTTLLSRCFQFAHEEIFSQLGSSELLLEFPKDLDLRMSLLPILHDDTVDDTCSFIIIPIKYCLFDVRHGAFNYNTLAGIIDL